MQNSIKFALMEPDVISVIIPVYNTESYLASCLDSVLSQSYRHLEVIVIDDGSTDFSLKIAEEYATQDPRLKVYSFKNEGQSAARNHGLDVATGSFISFVDSDDLLLPDALEILLELSKEINSDITEGSFIKGEVFTSTNFKGKIRREVFSSKKAIENVLYQREMLPSPCGKIYKASLFENLRFEKGLIYEDLDIFYKIYERAEKIAFINYPVYFYREVEGSTINSWKVQRLDVLRVTENIERYINEKYPELLPAAKDRRLSANFNMFALCSIHGENAQANKCWELIKEYRSNSLFNKNVRIKNKLGAALSYSGKTIFKNIARIVYSKKS